MTLVCTVARMTIDDDAKQSRPPSEPPITRIGAGVPISAVPPQPSPRKRLPTVAIVGIAVGAMVLLCGGVGVVAVALFPDAVRNAASTGGGPQMSTSTPAAPPAPKETFHQPQPTDFVLTVKTLEKKCFGSAGCNIEYRIEVAYNGAPLDPSRTWELTYEVKGGEDPQIGTLEVTATGWRTADRERIGTNSSKDELTATVVSVAMRLS